MDRPDERIRDTERHTPSDEAPRSGEVLGIGDVRPGGLDRTGPTHDKTHNREEEAERSHVTGERGSGAGELTGGTTGGTGPDTGGHGVHRRGSGATGTDLGGRP